MQAHEFPPLVEAFLIIEQPRQRLSHWTQALGPLDDKRAPPLAAVNGFYDPTCDQAVLGLRYDELALGVERLSYVVEVALLAGIGMIQPSELSEADRQRILGERLARCTVNVAHQRSVVGALAELVRRVGDPKPPRTSRNVMPHVLKPPRTPPTPMIAKGRAAPEPPPAAGRERITTAQMDPLDAQKLAATDLPAVVPVLDEPTRANPAPAAAEAAAPAEPAAEGSGELTPIDPYAPSTSPLPPGNIYARYLRSGRWVPLRIGALSLRGAVLMAGALPRVRDRVEIALGFADFRAIVRGTVRKVSTPEEAAQRGIASFSVGFELDDRARRQLTALLHAARAANVTIKPPPPRGERRYPVEWPICLETPRGSVHAEALDVSRDGMFVRQPTPPVRDLRLRFSIVLDDGGGPVSGSAHVVRFADAAAARSSGVAPGLGLRIVEMSTGDRERWRAFIARIERRAELRVLIGATRARLRELQGRLAAAGYAVACATDPEALRELASGTEHAADACLIDAAWRPPSPAATWSETLFPTRTVPCVAMRGDVRRAREAIDQVLSIM